MELREHGHGVQILPTGIGLTLVYAANGLFRFAVTDDDLAKSSELVAMAPPRPRLTPVTIQDFDVDDPYKHDSYTRPQGYPE
jgi:hypothetical protein